MCITENYIYIVDTDTTLQPKLQVHFCQTTELQQGQ